MLKECRKSEIPKFRKFKFISSSNFSSRCPFTSHLIPLSIESICNDESEKKEIKPNEYLSTNGQITDRKLNVRDKQFNLQDLFEMMNWIR